MEIGVGWCTWAADRGDGIVRPFLCASARACVRASVRASFLGPALGLSLLILGLLSLQQQQQQQQHGPVAGLTDTNNVPGLSFYDQVAVGLEPSGRNRR